MNKMMIGLAATTAALAGLSGTANAAPWNNGINQREARLEMQINHGMRTGALTRAEAVRLQHRLDSIQRLERNFRRDGFTFAERRMIDSRLDALAQSIRVQLADRDFRGGPRHGRF